MIYYPIVALLVAVGLALLVTRVATVALTVGSDAFMAGKTLA